PALGGGQSGYGRAAKVSHNLTNSHEKMIQYEVSSEQGVYFLYVTNNGRQDVKFSISVSLRHIMIMPVNHAHLATLQQSKEA
ncbi:hypothetical protein NPN18_26110, partial [Vibrio parahaemolyticus]|nr:hypothetical protein [Vibrio parahaemolyticus]